MIIRDIACGIICINLLNNLFYPNLMATIYFISDFFINNNSNKIHHLISLFTIYVNEYQLAEYDKQHICPTIINTEYSTIFLTVSLYITNPLLKKISHFLFLITFLKFRIYDFFLFLYKPTTPYIFDKYFPYCHISFFGFFALNLYWMFLIFKIICKPYFNQPYLNIICQDIVSYTIFLHIPLSIYIYQSLNWDIVRISLLAFSSYIYHQQVKYQFITYNKYIAIILKYSYLDTICIHLRILLTNITNIESCFIYTFISIIIDTCLSKYDNPIIQFNMILVLYLLLLISTINPFYELSFVATHFVLLFQTFIMCKNNQSLIKF